jgi:hypothetical protein
MQVQTTVDRIEYATCSRWWLLAALLLVSSPWPVLMAVWAGAIALATWHYGDEGGAA